MSTIRETVSANLRSDYMSYATPVLDALEERERAIADGLRTFANEKGLGDSEIDALFIEVGLMEPVVQEETIAEVDSADPIAALSAKVDALSTRLEQAISAAARQGVRV